MEITFEKISDEEHGVRIRRDDGSEEASVLNSRSFLRHDMAHLAVETELPIALGYWGSVARGASLSGLEIRGPDIVLAESLAGPVQTLMRVEADEDKFYRTLNYIIPRLATRDLACRIRERGRRLQGHWRGTPYGEEMLLTWNDGLTDV